MRGCMYRSISFASLCCATYYFTPVLWLSSPFAYFLSYLSPLFFKLPAASPQNNNVAPSKFDFCVHTWAKTNIKCPENGNIELSWVELILCSWDRHGPCFRQKGVEISYCLIKFWCVRVWPSTCLVGETEMETKIRGVGRLKSVPPHF